MFSSYLELIRINYWYKNIFVIPGIFFSYYLVGINNFYIFDNFLIILISFISIFAVCSSNYVINEITDVKFDKFHSIKKKRPIVSGKISKSSALLIYFFLILFSLYLSSYVNRQFSTLILLLFLMGIIYNIEPIRLKDYPFLDVICESFNNLLRLLLGWNIFTPDFLPPISLCIIFWTGGAFLMTMKRYAEYKFINNKKKSINYRKSFKFYNEKSLILFANFSAIFCSIFIGIFIAKYKLELILLTPFIAALFCYYYFLSEKKNSIAQSTEFLFKDRILVLIVITNVILAFVLIKYELSFLQIFDYFIIKNNLF